MHVLPNGRRCVAPNGPLLGRCLPRRFARCRDGYESPLGVTRSRTRAFARAPREPDDRTEPSGNVQHVQVALGVAGGYFLAARGR